MQASRRKGFFMKHNGSSLPINEPFYNLPTAVPVENRSYPIRWDFTTAVRFMEYVETSTDDDLTFVDKVLEIWYPKVPEDKGKALDAALRFYCAGKAPELGYYCPIFRAKEEKEAVYLRFLREYGIDLNRQPLHWWTFRNLLLHLNKRKEGTNEPRKSDF